MWCLCVKQEEITSGSQGKFMNVGTQESSTKKKKEYLWLRKHRLRSQFPEIPVPLPFKMLLFGLKLQRWPLDIHLPSSQADSFLNKATFSSHPMLVSQGLESNWDCFILFCFGFFLVTRLFFIIILIFSHSA